MLIRRFGGAVVGADAKGNMHVSQLLVETSEPLSFELLEELKAKQSKRWKEVGLAVKPEDVVILNLFSLGA